MHTVSFLLHAHLPYGIRPDLEISLEEAWLHEAATDCYLPLIDLMDRLGPPPSGPRFTLSLSPTLLELWAHPEFPSRYRQHLQNGLKIIGSEVTNSGHPAARREAARRIENQWLEAAKAFDRIKGDLISGFVQQANDGRIELITTAATHAFVPAFQNNPQFRHFQIRTGLQTFRRHCKREPDGFWLPECGYFPGLEKDLAEHGIRYFCLDSAGLAQAAPDGEVRSPLTCPNGLLALGRDARLSHKVWSAHSGYPGHSDYREFYHDGIHQVDTETCGSYALPDGGRLPFGLKYWRVTGQAEKDWYWPAVARKQVSRDAADFVASIRSSRAGLVFLPFDAELFGHWWHEGPQWLAEVLKLLEAASGMRIAAAGPASRAMSGALTGTPTASTWGRKSDYSFWINHDTDWIYPLLETAFERLQAQHYRKDETGALSQRALQQASRELLLASASDWPFMIRAGATIDYAKQRLRGHLQKCHYLLEGVEDDKVDWETLEILEWLNPAFQGLSFDRV